MKISKQKVELLNCLSYEDMLKNIEIAGRTCYKSESEFTKESGEKFVKKLNPGGRIAIITFHSLEDRIVKNSFKYLEKDCICPPSSPICTCDKKREIKIITRKPITASDRELCKNNRSHSAKLRVAEKIEV